MYDIFSDHYIFSCITLYTISYNMVYGSLLQTWTERQESLLTCATGASFLLFFKTQHEQI